jgi:riboflavin kinase/FMN adenylyltransferase
MMPPDGVYAVRVDRVGEGGDERALGLGALSVGVRPTVQAGPSVEVHVVDFRGDLYGARLRVHLLAFLREQKRFADLDALRAQIAADVERVRALR